MNSGVWSMSLHELHALHGFFVGVESVRSDRFAEMSVNDISCCQLI